MPPINAHNYPLYTDATGIGNTNLSWTSMMQIVSAQTTASTTCSVLMPTWQVWNQTATTITTGATTHVAVATWPHWLENTVHARPVRYVQRKPTEAEVKTALEREKKWQEAYAKHEAERLAAIARAELLLVQHLSAEQKEDYEKRGCFYMFTKSGKKYRIEKGWSGNVKLVDETNKPIHQLCAHPRETVPIPDNMLAQKLMLEADEDQFLRVANQHW